MPDRRTVALSRDASTSGVDGESVPVNTRTTESFPCCGWTIVLHTCATTGPSARGTTGRPSTSLRGSVSGEGKSRDTASTSGGDADVLLRAADQHGDDLVVRAVLAQIAVDLVLLGVLAVEQLFQQRVVEVGERFE